jgi:hypothetical protein
MVAGVPYQVLHSAVHRHPPDTTYKTSHANDLRKNVKKLRNVGQWAKIYYIELFRASEGTLSRWHWLHVQLLTPTNSHWVRVVIYGPFSLCVIHKESLYSSSGDINRLMMMIYKLLFVLDVNIPVIINLCH